MYLDMVIYNTRGIPMSLCDHLHSAHSLTYTDITQVYHHINQNKPKKERKKERKK